MPKLKSWLVYDAVEAPLGVIALAEHLPQLEHLGMLWQSDHVVPDVDLFPVLETLRIIVNVEYFSRKNWAQTDFGSGVRSVAITSLAIHELTDDSNVLGSFCDGTKYTFPNLRVVHFSQARVVVPKIYDFVRRHSTLLEVNISFAQWAIKSLRLEALLKLIHGTGRWVRPADQPWVVLDQPSFDEYVVDGAVPPDLAYNWGAFYDFAFSRAPIPDVDGPEEPRYTCTALAIRFLDKDDDYERTAQLPAGAEYFIDPKEGPCNLLPELQELRLSVTDEQDTGSTFRETMLYRSGSIPSYLKAWPKLRKLALHWPFRDAYWECPHWEHRHEEVPFVCAPCDSVKIPFLDWLAPHIRENPPR
ncbi:hypothetical protein PsYK624_010230 [Phanerochaete sordida]|uniref:Uncharacterized protein n=1 Tax=Phanerochaete sordida TaxID=48140 RepID=A0A9P3FYP2_9APHY|nr:hypothetical protein PsYK624_010230 [Phanerochaete sordida]